MKALTGKFFEVGVRFDKMLEDGIVKKVTETYCVDALTFTEGEKNITDEMSQYISGEFQVTKMKQSPYATVLTREGSGEDKFWKCKVVYSYLDEKTAKEKKSSVYYLVQSLNLKGALSELEAYLKDDMGDWEISCVQETKLVDVINLSEDGKENCTEQ